MIPKMKILFIILSICLSGITSQGAGNNGNLRLCVVEGRGYKKTPKSCPELEKNHANVECVIGSDRLDCLRRLGKGTVDFAVVDPEDLVIKSTDSNLLVTDLVKTKNSMFKSEIACVVSRSILSPGAPVVTAATVLGGAKLCHPGHGAMGVSDTLSEYLESLVTPSSCDPQYSLLENRLMAVEGFFTAACKPGPWIKDQTRDSELKAAHPSLCSLCSHSCGRDDAFYGSQGALSCLTSGAGTVTWASVDVVRHRFGLNGETEALDNAAGYAYLCKDGSWLPLNTSTPCVWLNVPWPVVLARGKSSEAVQQLERDLTDDDTPVSAGWRAALLSLLESREALPEPLQPPQSPEDYLARARGFREAYSRTGCNPSRHITVCAASTIEHNKCTSLADAGQVYGVEPPVQCSLRTGERACLRAVAIGEADVTFGDSDYLVQAQRDFGLKPILAEKNNVVKQMRFIVAYVLNDSSIQTVADLRGKMAAFPKQDGVAYHSVNPVIHHQFGGNVINFFKDLCVFGTERDDDGKLTSICPKENSLEAAMDGEEAALKMLVEKRVDVAFVGMDAVARYTGYSGTQSWSSQISTKNFKTICPYTSDYCYFAWASPGHAYIANTTSDTRIHEIQNALLQLDSLFGTKYPFDIPAFTMYGQYNGKSDVMFHDNMKELTTLKGLGDHPHSAYPRNYENNVIKDTILKDGWDNFYVQNSAVIVNGKFYSLVMVCLCFAWNL